MELSEALLEVQVVKFTTIYDTDVSHDPLRQILALRAPHPSSLDSTEVMGASVNIYSQLIVFNTCEDGSSQAWRDRLKVFRSKLTTIKAECNNLLHREPVETDSFIVIPVESTPPTPSHTT